MITAFCSTKTVCAQGLWYHLSCFGIQDWIVPYSSSTYHAPGKKATVTGITTGLSQGGKTLMKGAIGHRLRMQYLVPKIRMHYTYMGMGVGRGVWFS